MSRLQSPDELTIFREEVLASRDPRRPRISICAGTGCLASGASDVVDAVKAEVQQQGLEASVDFRGTGCHGFCEKGPIIVIDPEEICYLQVTPKDVHEIAEQTLKAHKLVDRLLYVDPATSETVIRESDIPFYKNQRRLVFGPNRQIDPQSLEDYLAIGGYSALAKALFEMTPEQIINEVKEANLRGRGGAGFPTGIKWEFARKSPGEPKYVVVNCDEGDPGAYMDRSLMEGNPYSVLEGLLIGAHAIGASEGYVYIRQEYPLAVKNLGVAIERATEHGLLGADILGSGFDFEIKVHQGAGAFVCGEETALLMSLEGMVGEPRPRPPYPAVKGLWGRPTNINNVETWATVPLIINRGAAEFASIGTEGSKGTKIFSLVGKITNTGLVEVPMGMTIRHIVEEIGGGAVGDVPIKAVQTGGPSGGCIPAKLFDLPIGYDSLAEVGSIMGSGGMIVMDENTCMVDVAKYFMYFLSDESCGKCFTCRKGTQRMHEVLDDISNGIGGPEQLELLEELAMVTREASMCALGQTAANPVLSTLKYFRDEYLEHLNSGRCPAGVCKGLITFSINDLCNGCTLCVGVCPEKAILGAKKEQHRIDDDACIRCGACKSVCKHGAVQVR